MFLHNMIFSFVLIHFVLLSQFNLTLIISQAMTESNLNANE